VEAYSDRIAKVRSTLEQEGAAASSAQGGRDAGASRSRGALSDCAEVASEIMQLLSERAGGRCRPATVARAEAMLQDVARAVDAIASPTAAAESDHATETQARSATSRRVLSTWCALARERLARLGSTNAPASSATAAAVGSVVETVADDADALVRVYFALDHEAVGAEPERKRVHEAIGRVELLQDSLDSLALSENCPEFRAERKLTTLLCEHLEAGLNMLAPQPVERTRSSSAAMDVGLPEVPSGSFLCADVTADSVTLQWAAPKDVFGQAMRVVRYELVVRRECDDGEWTTVDANIAEAQTNYNVHQHLIPGTAYRFRVRAEGSNGFGPWSMLRGVRTDAVAPPAPVRFRVTSVTHSSVELRWGLPELPGDVTADAYQLQLRSNLATGWEDFARPVRQPACRKLHLQPAAAYTFRVRAHVPGSGWGPWSNETSGTTCRLDDVIASVRRAAHVRARRTFGLQDPLPLPTTSEPHHPMPRVLGVPRAGTAAVTAPASDPRSRLAIFVRRNHLLQDTYDALVHLPPRDWARGTMVHFVGETGVDYGSLTREWLRLVVSSLANPHLALFRVVGSAQLSHPNPASVVQGRDHLRYFWLFGTTLGKAFLEGAIVDVRLTSLVLRTLLLRDGGALRDLQHFDPELHKNLSWMLTNDITGVIDETFTATVDILGEKKVRACVCACVRACSTFCLPLWMSFHTLHSLPLVLHLALYALCRVGTLHFALSFVPSFLVQHSVCHSASRSLHRTSPLSSHHTSTPIALV
jgi:hypothetical protein